VKGKLGPALILTFRAILEWAAQGRVVRQPATFKSRIMQLAACIGHFAGFGTLLEGSCPALSIVYFSIGIVGGSWAPGRGRYVHTYYQLKGLPSPASRRIRNSFGQACTKIAGCYISSETPALGNLCQASSSALKPRHVCTENKQLAPNIIPKLNPIRKTPPNARHSFSAHLMPRC